jgi:hypothetical protein
MKKQRKQLFAPHASSFASVTNLKNFDQHQKVELTVLLINESSQLGNSTKNTFTDLRPLVLPEGLVVAVDIFPVLS